MIRFRVWAFSCAAAALLAGCSSMVDGTTQELTVETPGVSGALCFLERPGYRYRIWTPKTILIQKTGDPLKVTCRAPGNREKVVIVEPEISDSVTLNVLNGFIPGALYDHFSGAMYPATDKVVIDFSDMIPEQMPEPDYQQVLDQNPSLMGMEEFRAGTPALQRDRYEAPQPLQPRRSENELFGSARQSAALTSSSSAEVAEQPPVVKSGGEGVDTADSLTRQMNPQVFGTPDGFAGGTPVIGGGAEPPPADFDADAIPVHIYPQ